MERTSIVLDASVIVKWFTQEEGKEKAVRIRNDFINNKIEIAVPDLIIYELSNALRFNPKFNQEDVKDAIESISTLDIDIIVPLQNTIDKSITLSFEHNITIYDAFYVALASELGFDLVTADEKLYNKLKSLGFIYLLDDTEF